MKLDYPKHGYLTAHSRPTLEWITTLRGPWIRVVVALIIIGGVTLTAYLGVERPSILLLSASLLPLAVALSLLRRWPELGILALIPVSLLVPFALGVGGQTYIPTSILLLAGLAGLALFNLIQGRVTITVPSTVLRPLFGFLLISFIAFISGQLRWFTVTSAPLAAQLGGLGIYFLCAIAFLLPAQQIRELKWLKWMSWLFLSIASLYMIGHILGLPPLRRLFPFGATGSLFWLWVGALAVSQALFNNKLNPLLRLALFVFVGSTAYVSYVIIENWVSAWLPFLAAIATISIIRFPPLLFVYGGGALLAGSSYLFEFIATDQYSFSTRLEAWDIMLQIIQVNPILGLGPANYYYYTPLYSIRGYYLSFNSHSQYVDLVAQTGVLSLICYFWLMWAIGRIGLDLLPRVQNGFTHAYVVGALGGLVGTLVSGFLGDWVIPFVYNVGYNGMRSGIFSWIFLGALVALYQIKQNTSHLQTPDP